MKHEQRWAEVRRARRHDDPAAETGRGKPAGKAPAGPDRSYEARVALGRGKQRSGCRVWRREACREGPGRVQYEGRRKRRRDEGHHERAQKLNRRWKALVALAVRIHLSESGTI
ncbi:hypothetical protein NDU88_006488 [Pleurodeles waltl]|uniref:Uncharacterized protein n=1 Tax=Pleurodeles waltl TaxID=8319 RepID=A0AAV7RQD5_PLEWA|nr:hypothetical protein NDU88_006488 [Pleurodeles waltl]